MKILAGLHNKMVMQRNKSNIGETLVYLSTDNKAAFSVTSKHDITSVITEETQNEKGGYLYSVLLTGFPVGGKYELTLCAETSAKETPNKLTFTDIMVGDVWLLGGQSNMQGIGWMKNGALPENPMVMSFTHKDKWETAKDPLHSLHDANYPVHVVYSGGGEPAKHMGVGPGLSFANEMHSIYNIPQGLIPCAHGGTSMDQWAPSLKHLCRNSFYGSAVERFKQCGSRIAGVLWYQGCSDSGDASANVYKKKMHTLVESFRQDFQSPSLPFVIVQIARCLGGANNPSYGWNEVQYQQLILQREISNLLTVSAIDLDLDDGIHISGEEQIRLGKRLSRAMRAITDPAAGINKTIDVDSVRWVTNKQSGMADIEVTFTNVTGKLTSCGRPNGFELRGSNLVLDQYRIAKVTPDGNKVILRTTLPEPQDNLYLHYGLGIMPYCNITDEADIAVPVFGPIIPEMP